MQREQTELKQTTAEKPQSKYLAMTLEEHLWVFVCFSLTLCVAEIIQIADYFGGKSLNWIRVDE